MVTLRASLVSFPLLATVLSALAASGSPVVGREELRLAPLYVGIPILIIGAAVELLCRLSSSRIAGRLATSPWRWHPELLSSDWPLGISRRLLVATLTRGIFGPCSPPCRSWL